MLQPTKTAADVRCRKTHYCVNCDGEFSYLLERKVDVGGSNPREAAIRTRAAAVEASEHAVDRHACPHCGVIQPEMVAADQEPRFALGLVCGLASILFPLLLGLSGGLSIYVASQLSVFLLACSSGAYVWGALHDPNRTPHLNLPAARKELEDGTLHEGDPRSGCAVPDPDDHTKMPLVRAPAVWRRLGLGLAGAAGLAVFSPVLLALFGGWYVNPACQPAVVGPGETARFVFHDERITSLAGMWHGHAVAEIANAQELDVLGNAATAKTKDSAWSREPAASASLTHSENPMYIDVAMPDLPDLVGRVVDLRLDAAAVYPIRTVEGQPLEERERKFQYDVAVILAPAGAGRWYTNAFWYGHLFALAAWGGAFAAFHFGCRDLRAARSQTKVQSEDE